MKIHRFARLIAVCLIVGGHLFGSVSRSTAQLRTPVPMPMPNTRSPGRNIEHQILSTRAQIAQLEVRLKQARATYTPNSPQVRAIERKLYRNRALLDSLLLRQGLQKRQKPGIQLLNCA